MMNTAVSLATHDDPWLVEYYARDGSVFLDTHYLIRGVAGALFWKLVREHQHARRREFSLRELRLSGEELRLPEGQDNLSTRVLLLQRRLEQRQAPVRIRKAGRGRIRVDVLEPLLLSRVGGGSPVVGEDQFANLQFSSSISRTAIVPGSR